MSIGRCGCGRFVLEVKNGKDDEWAAECTECQSNGGQYFKSSAWKETIIEKRAVEERAKRLTGLR